MDKKPKEAKEQPAEKLIYIADADESELGKDSVITNKRSELTWNKNPKPRKPGQ